MDTRNNQILIQNSFSILLYVVYGFSFYAFFIDSFYKAKLVLSNAAIFALISRDFQMYFHISRYHLGSMTFNGLFKRASIVLISNAFCLRCS